MPVHMKNAMRRPLAYGPGPAAPPHQGAERTYFWNMDCSGGGASPGLPAGAVVTVVCGRGPSSAAVTATDVENAPGNLAPPWGTHSPDPAL